MKAWLELRRLPRRLWVLAAATLINRMGTMALPFLPLYLTRGMGFTAGQAGGVLALYGAVAFGVSPLAGRLCDRLGTSRVMRASLALSGLTMIVFPLAGSFGEVLVMTVAWAAATEAFRPAGMAAVSESAPEDMRKQAYALHRLAMNLGMSVGPAIGGLLAAVSFPAVWFVDGATSLAAALVLGLALTDAPPSHGAPSSGGPSGRGLSDPRLLYCLLAAVPVSMVFFQHEASLSLFLVRDLRMKESFYGLLFTLNTLLIVALEIPLNHATAHWPHRRTLSLGAALFAGGFGAYALLTSAWHALAATAIWTFGEMILLPGLTAYVAEISPARRRGEYMGLYTMGFSFSFILGSWGGILALDLWGPTVLWTLSFAAGMLSAVLFARIKGSPKAGSATTTLAPDPAGL